MKKILLTAIAALGMLTTAVQAQTWSYVDVIDGSNFVATANTYNVATGLANDWVTTVDAVGIWRYRYSGPGAVSWNTTAYDGRFAGGVADPALYTEVSGLLPNTEYMVRVYGVYPRTVTNEVVSTRPRYGAMFSTDGDAIYDTVNSHMDLSRITWVDNATAVGNVLPYPGGGDTRFFTQINETLITDATGSGRMYLYIPNYLPDGSLQDRFNLDGFAFAIPEPSAFALLGLGLAALLTSRRRA